MDAGGQTMNTKTAKPATSKNRQQNTNQQAKSTFACKCIE